MSQTVQGIVASQGIAMAPIKLFIKEKVSVQKMAIADSAKEKEIEKLQNAFRSYKEELEGRSFSSETEQQVTEAHIELLSDPYFSDTAVGKITELNVASDWALKETVEEMAAMMESLDDDYLKERAADYRDIGDNLMYQLKGIRPANLSSLDQEYIVVSDELTPSDTSLMDKQKVVGFANDLGGKTSHTSIIAQTLGIPCLVGMKDVTKKVEDGMPAILDAEKGVLIIDPTPEEIASYEVLIEEMEVEKKRLEEIKDDEAITIDGRKVEVVCNMGNLEDLALGLDHGAEGVGLFRTEFLYMENTHFPTEEEQLEVYKEAAETVGERPLLIRTLDIGGDKDLTYFDFPNEENPFLGWRALRICFDMPELFDTQLRAILRASAFGNVKILLPMIISVEELISVQERIAALKEDLRSESVDFDENVEVGVMIETPASVIIADALIDHCDYFSIGTNDLTQYILAVDRGNEKIARLYNSYHPAVLRAISHVIEASHKKGKWTGMCGGFAGDTNATYLLLGMGLDEFSAPGAKIPKVKDIIMRSSMEEAKKFAENVLSLQKTNEIEEMIEKNEYR